MIQQTHSLRARFGVTVVLFLMPLFAQADMRPNILIAISDDVSFPHASAYGSRMVNTPAFDRVAQNGVLFQNAFCPAPGCSPSRAAFLTGRHIWMLEEAGTHASYFPAKFQTFPERLSAAGYFVGSTGKGWGPGNFQRDGRRHNPAGKAWKEKEGYVDSFRSFLKDRPSDQPFCFWFGSTDAHRSFKKNAGLDSGKSLDQAEVPGFLPDRPEIRSDLLDYAFEVERFDRDCDQMLQLLDEAGELKNTLVIITSDNGMPFPRAKANCYEFGIHMPLAVCWPDQIPGQRRIDDPVGFTDLTATIYDATGVAPPTDEPIVGRSLLPVLKSEKSGRVETDRTAVFSGRERHSSSRFNTLGYPQRAIRTDRFLYILNMKPERWPAGPGERFDKVIYDEGGEVKQSSLSSPHAGYHDIDGCPTLSFLVEHRSDPEIDRYLQLAVARRPEAELFDIRVDADCLNNLAGHPEYQSIRNDLHDQLMKELHRTADARVLDGGDIWETYPRVSGLRWFPTPDWAKEHPENVPKAEWLEKARPRK